MRSIFVMRRPGLMVVSGTVIEMNEGEIVIENTFLFPVSQREENVRIHLDVEKEKISNMKIQIGAAIVASTSDHFVVEMLKEGGETPDREFFLKGFNVRYNGSFDFNRHGTEKEQHVFVGNVLNATSGKNKDGKYWTNLVIGWKRQGKDETRQVVYYGSKPLDHLARSRVIAVTGESKRTETSFYFESTEIYEF